jgi:hypothetical protein
VPRLTEEDYLERYFSDTGGAVRVGDGSVWYLYTRKAAEEIRAWCPDARIIVLLRDPTEMLHSLHSQLVFNGDEDIDDFAAALDAEEDRRRGRRIPPGASCAEILFYRDIADYATQVSRFLDAFPADQVRILLFEDFVEDTPAAYRDTLEFLGVDPSFRPRLGVVNPNKVVRTRAAHEFLRRPPSLVRRVARAIVPSTRSRDALRRRLMRLNTRFVRRPGMDPTLRATLRRELAPGVRRLGEILGRDLRAWTDDPTEGRRT